MTAGPLRLLVVDDDPVARLVLSRILARLGHQTYTASNVAGGVDVALQAQPDLVFSDFDMPDGTGDDLLTTVRQCGLMMPVVLVTGVAGLEQTRSRFGSGLVAELPTLAATLTKPVDSRAVSVCLTSVLGHLAAA